MCRRRGHCSRPDAIGNSGGQCVGMRWRPDTRRQRRGDRTPGPRRRVLGRPSYVCVSARECACVCVHQAPAYGSEGCTPSSIRPRLAPLPTLGQRTCWQNDGLRRLYSLPMTQQFGTKTNEKRANPEGSNRRKSALWDDAVMVPMSFRQRKRTPLSPLRSLQRREDAVWVLSGESLCSFAAADVATTSAETHVAISR